ncbi:2-hydroxyacyl-CoA dehydratase, partial [Candidatus Fermentibacterales bacterium]|nr:2-hydroxyacyl-CoA dehydratase [Candidatus Fermentibacterales bacterium]
YSVTPHGGTPYQLSAVEFLKTQLQGVVRKLEQLTGAGVDEEMLSRSRALFNDLRGRIRGLRDMVYSSRRPPLPGLEMFLAEFTGIHTCSEPEESLRVLDDLVETAQRRLERNESPLSPDPLRVFWVTPPTDAALLTLLEDMGGCVAGTDYLITHSFLPLSTDRPVLDAVAENCMDDPMLGSTFFKARRVVEGARKFGAEGVVISGIYGASHCPWEEKAISALVQRELGLPVLSFDVPFSPGRHSEQVVNRMQSFMQLLRDKRRSTVAVQGAREGAGPSSGSCDPLEYFRNSMAWEVDGIRAEKRRGRGVVGIYCEFTPRDLILAAGALPVCLCGASRRTIPAAETVLPSNLCPLIKSSFGYILTARCPFFVVSDLIVAETTCDGKKKMYELIAGRRPQHILELTQKVEESEAFSHWLSEVEKLKARLEEVFSREITEEDLRSGIARMNAERSLLREALMLGAEDPPVVSGLDLARLRYRVSGLDSNLGMLRSSIETVRSRKRRGTSVCAPGVPRIMVSGCPMAEGTMKVIELIEQCGGVVVVQETCSGWKPLDELVCEHEAPLVAIARRHFRIPCSCMTPNRGRIELQDRLLRDFGVQAVVDLVWHACHTYNVESYAIERHIKEDLGIPFLKIETDYSDSDRERLLIRIQTMLEMV